jgi:tRNA(fMet)-specific endonuclease VapC
VRYVVDTNTLIARLNGNQRVAERLLALSPEQIMLCAPVVAELVFGAHLSSRRAPNLDRVNRLAAGMDVVPFDEGAARRFGELKSKLRRRGITKTDFDLAIAAIALEQQAVLVTNDQALHDGSIDGLDVEDWLSD